MKYIALLVLTGCQALKVDDALVKELTRPEKHTTVGSPLTGNPPAIPWWIVALGGCFLLWKLTKED